MYKANIEKKNLYRKATARYKSCTGRLLYDEIAENGRKLQLVDGGVAVNGTVALHTVTAEPVGKIQPLVQLVRLQSGQGGEVHPVFVQLPQERADEPVPGAVVSTAFTGLLAEKPWAVRV